MTNFILVKKGTAARVPVPDILPQTVEALADLSWTDASLNLRDCAWWPEEVVSVQYDPRSQMLDGTETLVVVPDRKVVQSRQNVRDLTEAELQGLTTTLQAETRALADKVDDAVATRLSRRLRLAVPDGLRFAAAHAYRDADYQGAPGVLVTSYADGAGVDYREAADRIIAEADAVLAAVEALEVLRTGKHLVMRQTSVEAAQEIYRDLISKISQVAVP